MQAIRAHISRVMFFIAAVLAATASYAQDKVDITRDIHYADNKLQTVDVYTTDVCKTKRCPVVMWVHGGGWTHGDTGGDRSTKMQTLWAQQGIVMVGVNYRLTPEVQHPAHVQDIAAAINWVHRNIAQYGGDAERLSLLGHSAGAHLVALVATNPNYLAAYQLEPARAIKNVFPIDTASFDLTDESSRFVGKRVKAAFGTDPSVLHDASPIWQVHNGGVYPPFIIAATKIRQDAIETSEILQKKLRAVGDSAELMVMDYPGARQLKAHMLIADDLANLDSTMTQALLKRVLQGA